MVSLTSLLVLVSLYSQTSKNLPRTSYFKLIDIWFIGLIFLDFCVILDLVIIEFNRESRSHRRANILKMNEERKSYTNFPSLDKFIGKKEVDNYKIHNVTTANLVSITPYPTGHEMKKKFQFNMLRLNHISKIVFPIVYVIFIGVFIGVASFNLFRE